MPKVDDVAHVVLILVLISINIMRVVHIRNMARWFEKLAIPTNKLVHLVGLIPYFPGFAPP